MRPVSFLLGGLGLAITAKIGVTLMAATAPDAGGPITPPAYTPHSSFVAAASAQEATEEMTTAAEPKVCEAPEELLESIKRERELLAAQKDRNAERSVEHDLAAETLQIEQQRLTDLKQELEHLLAKVEASQTADVNRLVALYQNMKPRDAANIMNDLDIEVTVMVLGTMNERDAAPIMASLDPVRARAVSQIILQRSKLPGDQRLDDIRL